MLGSTVVVLGALLAATSARSVNEPAGGAGGSQRAVLMSFTALFILATLALVAAILSAAHARDRAQRELHERLAHTERALADKQWQADELRRERDFSVAVLDSAVALVVVYDAQGRIIDFNTACQRLTGYSEREVLGRSFWEILLAPEYVPLFAAELERLHFDDTPETIEVIWVSKYDRWHRLAITTTVLYDRDGRVTFYIASGADVTEQRTQEEQLRRRADTDPLTGLVNRATLRRCLERALDPHAGGRSAALLFCDLDRFKAVNDTFGHATGDQLLIAVARRMRQSVRSRDTVARMGGDEFVILCPELSPDDTRKLAHRVRTTVERPYRLPVGEVRVGVSVGTAVAQAGADPDATLGIADAAMYRRKAARRQVTA